MWQDAEYDKGLSQEEAVSDRHDLYDQHYGHMQDPVYSEIRAETFDDDLGQTGWLTLAELRTFMGRLSLNASCRVLEVACGGGGAAIAIAHEAGAHVVGVDVNHHAIQAASARAAAEVHNDRVLFRQVDARQPLPFESASFDGLFCNDAINHLGDRRALLAEWLRILKPGGRLLYTDPLVITGAITAEEFMARSTIGPNMFMPRGENELLLHEAGFQDVVCMDASDNVITLSARWRDVRSLHQQTLVALETEPGYAATQAFLSTVHVLAEEGRLSRYAFACRRPGRR